MKQSAIIYDINNIREEFDFHDFRLSFEFSMNEFGVHIIQEIEETDSRLDIIVKYDSISEKLFVDIDEIYNTYILYTYPSPRDVEESRFASNDG